MKCNTRPASQYDSWTRLNVCTERGTTPHWLDLARLSAPVGCFQSGPSLSLFAASQATPGPGPAPILSAPSSIAPPLDITAREQRAPHALPSIGNVINFVSILQVFYCAVFDEMINWPGRRKWYGYNKVEGKVLPVHAMKAYRGVGVKLHSILTSALDESKGVNFTPRPLYPRERTPVPNEQNAERAS